MSFSILRGLAEARKVNCVVLQKRYVHGLVTKTVVNSVTATISGPPLALAAAVTAPDKLEEVRTFEREWRTRQDSNL